MYLCVWVYKHMQIYMQAIHKYKNVITKLKVQIFQAMKKNEILTYLKSELLMINYWLITVITNTLKILSKESKLQKYFWKHNYCNWVWQNKVETDSHSSNRITVYKR